MDVNLEGVHMKIKMTLLILSMIMFGLAACGTDPRNVADAYATTSQADQAAADAALQRTITAEEQAQKMADAKALEGERVAAKQRALRYGSIAGVIALIICLSASAWVYLKYVAPGLAQAAVTAADIRSRCIPMDRGTKTYPMLLTQLSNGRIALAIPGIDSVLMIDRPHEPNAQMIAVQGQVQALGLLADAAKRSKQDGTLAMLQAPVINAMDMEQVSPKVKVYRTRKEGNHENVQ
jgi:hypothetical protein